MSLMSLSTQCGLGFVFAAIAVILFFAAKFRNAGNNALTDRVALHAYGESHNYSVVAIVLVVVAVIVAMVVW